MFPSKTTGIVLDVARQRGGAEPHATVLHDHSRWGNDGAFLGAGEPAWVQLPSGLWVLHFDGTNDNVVFGSPPSLQLLDKLSVELWLYAETIVALDQVAVAGKSTVLAVNGYALSIYDGGMRFYVLNRRAIDPTPLVLLTWHHVVGTFDDALVTDEIKLYIDGAEVDVDALATPTTDAGTFRLADINGAYNFFHGFQALARVYSYALTPAQIRAKFTATRRLFGV